MFVYKTFMVLNAKFNNIS